MILLDTNVFSGFRSGRPDIVRRVRRAESILLSAIVAGELLKGFHLGSRLEENRRDLEEFLSEPRTRLVSVTRATALRYGQIEAALERKGRPIPTNDIWIAAQAFEFGAELLSFDAHFREIDGLFWTHLPA